MDPWLIFVIISAVWLVFGATGSVYWFINHYGKITVGQLLEMVFFGSITGLIIWMLFFCSKYDVMNKVIYRRKR